MKSTVYNQLKEVEEMDIKLRGLNSPSEIDVAELQKTILGRYEKNPVLYDAIKGRQGIEESLEELGRVNKGIRKILPRRKNKNHNERLEQLGELISEPVHLQASGIFTPDNLITTCIEIMPLAFGAAYLTQRYLLPLDPAGLSSETFQRIQYNYQVTIPLLFSAFGGLTFGLIQNVGRLDKLLPTKQAKYLDERVVEFYK